MTMTIFLGDKHEKQVRLMISRQNLQKNVGVEFEYKHSHIDAKKITINNFYCLLVGNLSNIPRYIVLDNKL